MQSDIALQELAAAYQALLTENLAVAAALKHESKRYQRFIPSFIDDAAKPESQDALSAAIESMTRLHVDKTSAQYGLICVSPETHQQILQLNQAKKVFKASVLAIRDIHQQRESSSQRIQRLITQEVTEKGFRTPALNEAFHAIGDRGLDLKRCYANIRVLPSPLEMVSWTWVTRHSRVQRISRDEALRLAEKLPSKSAITALSLLARLHKDEYLARKLSLPNQLRCNYVLENDKRGYVTVSGVLVVPQVDLPPRIKWRDNPGEDSDKTVVRRSVLEPSMYIKALRLYRYSNR